LWFEKNSLSSLPDRNPMDAVNPWSSGQGGDTSKGENSASETQIGPPCEKEKR
jgi:hypothetical protein